MRAMAVVAPDEQAIVARDEWEAPTELFNAYDHLYRFALDVAANAANTCCRDYLDRETNGLACSWKRYHPSPKRGENIHRPVWCHPPHSDPGPWMRKARREASGGVTVVALVPAMTGEDWWHDDVMPCASIRFLRGHQKFRLQRIPLTERGARAVARGPQLAFAIAVFKPGVTL